MPHGQKIDDAHNKAEELSDQQMSRLIVFMNARAIEV
jgi:hypothetical protein